MKKIYWFEQSCIKILTDSGKTIYFDPYNISYKDEADYICISHTHYDHFSEEDIKKIIKSSTLVFAPIDCHPQSFKITNYLKPFDKFEDENIKLKTIPAYNVNKAFHQKNKNWLGYILEIDGIKIYHAGDTDLIDEMKEAAGVDIALLPIGGTYTMNSREAAKAVNTCIKPKKVIPIHWGSVVGSRADAELFIKSVNCEAEILESN